MSAGRGDEFRHEIARLHDHGRLLEVTWKTAAAAFHLSQFIDTACNGELSTRHEAEEDEVAWRDIAPPPSFEFADNAVDDAWLYPETLPPRSPWHGHPIFLAEPESAPRFLRWGDASKPVLAGAKNAGYSAENPHEELDHVALALGLVAEGRMTPAFVLAIAAETVLPMGFIRLKQGGFLAFNSHRHAIWHKAKRSTEIGSGRRSSRYRAVMNCSYEVMFFEGRAGDPTNIVRAVKGRRALGMPSK
ncbi:MAG: hypothetical protein WBX25_13385 [Rhodomicrobium sp.]